MKNTIKRILLLLPVISVLLVALAVPAFADGIDGGTVSSVVFEDCLYTNNGAYDGRQYIDVELGSSVSLIGGDTYSFPIFIEIDVTSLPGATFDTYSSETFAISLSFTDGSEVNYVCTRMISNGEQLTVYIKNSVGSVTFNYDFSVNNVSSFRVLATDDDLFSYFSRIDYTYYTLSSSSTEPIGDVWTDIMTWITSALNSVMGAFYVDGSLTLLGTLAVIGVSVGICFLLIGLIQRFLHLRG